jgi:chaperone modulatory protein CbpM
VQNLKSEFGVNDEGIDVILHLLDQLHGLRGAFMQLHKGHARHVGLGRGNGARPQA